MTSSSAEEYTKVLRRKMISEVLHQKQPQNHEIWQLQQQKQPQSQPQRISRPNEAKSRPTSRSEQRRSHSAQGKRSSAAASNVNSGAEPSQPKNVQNRPGLGRRSATQLELSRRKRNEEDGMGTPIRQSKWRSQEHLDQVNVLPIVLDSIFILSTVWKLHDFSVSQILREINVGEFRVSKSAIFEG